MRLVEIGSGSFGTVFEIPGSGWCIKKTVRAPSAALWLEFVNGAHICERVNTSAWETIVRSERFPDALMPRVPEYLCSYGMEGHDQTAEQWFAQNGHLFPSENDGQRPGPVIFLERVPTLPRAMRYSLIRRYFKPEDWSAILADRGSRAPVCRVYLGNWSTDIPFAKREEELKTMRDFPLYVDQLRELDMDPLILAKDMALGLAAGHWAALCNMRGVEYVVGRRSDQSTLVTSMVSDADRASVAGAFGRLVRNMGPVRLQPERSTQLWMMDFDKAGRFDESVDKHYHENIRKLVSDTRSAASGPFYPRVLARIDFEWTLWLTFSRTYIHASRTILSDALERAQGCGFVRDPERIDLVMRRPGRVISEWMRAEAQEHQISGREFTRRLKDRGWQLP